MQSFLVIKEKGRIKYIHYAESPTSSRQTLSEFLMCKIVNDKNKKNENSKASKLKSNVFVFVKNGVALKWVLEDIF